MQEANQTRLKMVHETAYVPRVVSVTSPEAQCAAARAAVDKEDRKMLTKNVFGKQVREWSEVQAQDAKATRVPIKRILGMQNEEGNEKRRHEGARQPAGDGCCEL